MIGRSLVIALSGFSIFMILVAFGSVGYYSSIINNQKDQISGQQSQINDLNDRAAQLGTLSSQKQQQLENQITGLQNQLTEANKINSLQMSKIWLKDTTVNQDRGAGVYYQYHADYAGYITVNVQSSTTSNQYVQVTWTSNGINYDNKITVGTMGTATFPVLPSSDIKVIIANTNLLNGATATATITYTY